MVQAPTFPIAASFGTYGSGGMKELVHVFATAGANTVSLKKVCFIIDAAVEEIGMQPTTPSAKGLNGRDQGQIDS